MHSFSAETVANLKRLIDGHSPGDLTVMGAEQAKLLGKRLVAEHFDAIYCSDSKRTRQVDSSMLLFDARANEIHLDGLCHYDGEISTGSEVNTAASRKGITNPLPTFHVSRLCWFCG